ncbi:MAG: glycoside hydrolase family 127 protein [Pedobacter sp.]|nr:glycoside hydrolase family 127 protein [Pedobacter sp.]
MNKFSLDVCILVSLALSIPSTLVIAQDKLHIADSETITGFIGERLMNSYNNRILQQDVDMLVEPFRHREETNQWQSEFWGKWFTSGVLAYRYHPTSALKAKLQEAVKGLIATQTADGYIGNYAKNFRLKEWDIWGRKYCMLGLLDYYELTKDLSSLEAAKKVADNLMSDLKKADGILVTKGNYRGMAASSILEPMCQLYRATKDKKYISFAEEIVKQWERPDGPKLISKSEIDVAKRFPKPASWYSFEQGQKAYEMMSCYEGLLELYRITGKPEYKMAVENTWQNIYNTEINIAGSGAASEMWFGGKILQTNPIHHYQETCVTVTWIKLCHQLFRLTGESKYADAAEQSFYNALLGSMSSDGYEWAKYTPLTGLRLPGSGQCGMDLNCCVASGPRALFNFPAHMVMKARDAVFINYYADGVFKTTTPKGKLIELTQQTSYPKNGLIRLTLKLAKPETFSINLRIPSWSLKNRLTTNGTLIDHVTPGYQIITRTWENGDLIELELDMRGRVAYTGDKPEYAAILRGPILLARDESLKGIDMAAIVSPGGKDGYVSLQEVTSTNSWMQFRLQFSPESYKEGGDKPVYVDLCDYASAGNHSSSSFRTWFPQLIDPKSF